jgi:4-alpha-glucanotransferase
LGCDVIGLNPLHALFPASPGLCSPYSPSSRTFLNFLYIAIDEIPEFASCDEALALVNQPPFQAALAAVRATDVVMYEQVATLKMCVLRLLHQQWLANASTIGVQRMRAFHDFVEQGGDALRSHALFDALDAQFRPQGMHGWHQWPVEFRDPRGAATVAFAQHNDDQVSFYLYAQWLAHEQLGHAQRHAIDRGMRIGLYGDLAVGANPDGAEVWADQSLYVQGIAVGAPPDPLALGGQDWGIPPMNPAVLRATAMQPMRELLRANMRYSGALRIDHVMSLFRLWWVPRGMSAVQGVYVHYPLDELMQCVVETSNAARCLVIGEDLGTVPDEVRDAMARHVLFHYKVLLFEKRDGNFIAPSDYVRESIATATTHDLPPLRAWWEELDLNLREGLRLYPNGTIAAQLRQERDHDRRALLRALRDANLWHWQDHDPLPEFSFALSRAIHLYLGQAQAALVLIQLEDLIGMTDPVNVPGTHIEHANWQRKIATITTDIFAKEEVREMLLALNQARAGMSPSGN